MNPNRGEAPANFELPPQPATPEGEQRQERAVEAPASRPESSGSRPQQPAYAAFRRQPCPEAEAWSASCTSLPCFPELTDDEVATVIAALERT